MAMEQSYVSAMNRGTKRTPPRRVWTPSSRTHSTSHCNNNVVIAAGAANNKKRKDGDAGFHSIIQPSNTIVSALGSPKTPRVNSNTASPKDAMSDQVPDNTLLAGYLAHEFLTKGTLRGKVWNPAQAVMQMAAGSRRNEQVKPGYDQRGEAAKPAKPLLLPTVKRQTQLKNSHDKQATSYEQVTNLLKSGRVHLPGVINPIQLDRFLQS